MTVGGLDDALHNIIKLAQEQSIPFVFALGRRALGRACAKLVPVSVVGVFNYEGSEVSMKNCVCSLFLFSLCFIWKLSLLIM